MIRIYLLLGSLLLLIVMGCTSDNTETQAEKGCTGCHQMQLDTAHNFTCTTCHNGSDDSGEKDIAHQGLIKSPAHPDHMIQSCGSCHNQFTGQLQQSLHYTLKNSTNIFRKIFGAETRLDSFIDTPVSQKPQNPTELADDLLRRRCFRCHLFTEGDTYPAVSRGTGCSACHLYFKNGKLQSHQFKKPSDKQCLSCHYGNYVGFDYYGRFEHDFNREYRTPYTTKNDHFRPYGVEYHELSPDIHRQKMMACIDCHTGPELMGSSSEKPSCKGCHKEDIITRQRPGNIKEKNENFILIAGDGTEHRIPLMNHPSHNQYKEQIACQSCHAQWTFNDSGKHFLRSDTDNYDVFFNLSVQGSAEIETIVDNNNDFEKTELPLVMRDKITGKQSDGLWYKGYTLRRWESVNLGRDSNGAITPVRPLLDYSLSWIDADDTIRFDSISSTPSNGVMMPYVPHTTGSPGLFYSERIRQFLENERSRREKN